MKKINFLIRFILSILAVLIYSLVFLRCESKVSAPNDEEGDSGFKRELPVLIKGEVKDADTGNPVAYAVLQLCNSEWISIAYCVADYYGKFMYDITSLADSSIVIIANATDYNYETSRIIIDKRNHSINMNAIYLHKCNNTKHILSSSSGVQASFANTEALNGEPVKIEIPAQAVSRDFEIKISLIPADQLPPIITIGAVLAAVKFDPEGTQLNNPATLTLSLPYKQKTGTHQFLYILDKQKNKWDSYKYYGVVNASGTIAEVKVTQFLFYAIIDTGFVVKILPTKISIDQNTSPENVECYMGERVEKHFQIKNTITNSGTTGEVSNVWLKNISRTIFKTFDGRVDHCLILNSPALPLKYFINNNVTGPEGHLQESGRWIYRWTLAKFFIEESADVSSTNPGNSWMGRINLIKEEWRVTSCNWWWMPEKEPGIYLGPF